MPSKTHAMYIDRFYIKKDRIEEALDWLEDKLGYDPREHWWIKETWEGDIAGASPNRGDEARIRLSDHDSGPFCDGSLDADDLREFAEEFACAGTAVVLLDDAADEFFVVGAGEHGIYANNGFLVDMFEARIEDLEEDARFTHETAELCASPLTTAELTAMAAAPIAYDEISDRDIDKEVPDASID